MDFDSREVRGGVGAVSEMQVEGVCGCGRREVVGR